MVGERRRLTRGRKVFRELIFLIVLRDRDLKQQALPQSQILLLTMDLDSWEVLEGLLQWHQQDPSMYGAGANFPYGFPNMFHGSHGHGHGHAHAHGYYHHLRQVWFIFELQSCTRFVKYVVLIEEQDKDQDHHPLIPCWELVGQ
ncbi:hypothetical protein SDJN03_18357, partial [Cucurbita argyrosperma subsp. sororia]